MALLTFPTVDDPLPRAAPPAAVTSADLRTARRGDRAAFGRLVRAHQGLAYSVALRITGRRADAEELAQDAFLQLHAQLASIEDDAHLAHWLRRTVAHRSIDRLRSNARDPARGAEAASDTLVAPQRHEDHLLQRALGALLDGLPGPARAVIVLRFQEDLDPTEIAATLDMPLNTVKSHLRRSLDWLRRTAPELNHVP